MALIPRFNANDIKKMLVANKEKIEAAIILNLKFVGETFVRNARSTTTYKDRTGNLRSSIGYLILKDGEQLYSSFPGEIAAGQKKGKQVALDAAATFHSGLVLIVVAGMEYAAAVESKNFDVLTSSSITAANDLTTALGRLTKKIKG